MARRKSTKTSKPAQIEKKAPTGYEATPAGHLQMIYSQTKSSVIEAQEVVMRGSQILRQIEREFDRRNKDADKKKPDSGGGSGGK